MEIYKYLPKERDTFFDSFLLRFSQPSALNDPYECMPHIQEVDRTKFVGGVVERNRDEVMAGAKSLAQQKKRGRAIKKVSRQLAKDYKKHPDYLSDLFLEKYKKHLNNTLGVFSLTKRQNSILMWAHYASNHEGFVLGFNPEHPFFSRQSDDNPDTGTVQEVNYSATRMDIAIETIAIESRMFLLKNEEWKYEEEMRLIRRLDKAAEILKTIDPYAYLFAIPKDAIASVTLGMNCSEKMQKSIIEKVARDSSLTHVRLTKAVMNPKSFEIDTVDLLQF